MTKPGNSDGEPDRDEPDRAEDEAREPESEIVEHEPEPVDPEPLMTELEKAPPPPEEPVMPTAREARARRVTDVPAPSFLRYAFYLYVLAGVIGVVGGIFMMLNKQEIIDEIIRGNKDPKITEAQIASGTNTLLWLLLIVTITFGVLFGLFGYKAQEGVRRARVLLTIFSVIVVLFYYVLFPTPFGLISAFLALISTVLLYLPSATAYFRRHEGV